MNKLYSYSIDSNYSLRMCALPRDRSFLQCCFHSSNFCTYYGSFYLELKKSNVLLIEYFLSFMNIKIFPNNNKFIYLYDLRQEIMGSTIPWNMYTLLAFLVIQFKLSIRFSWENSSAKVMFPYTYGFPANMPAPRICLD